MAIFINTYDKLDKFLDTRYDYVYVSIGSKLNQSYINKHARTTNAREQMLPQFLQGNIDVRILSIVVDVFPDMDSVIQSTRLLDDAITDNITCIVLNKFCNHAFITSFVEKMTDYFQCNQMSPSNCMICNYVRHINTPNPIEQESEDGIPSTIQKCLNICNNGKYDKCFYQWFGYRTNFNNYIYNYKNMRMYEFHPAHMNTVEELLKLIPGVRNNSSTVVQNQSVIHIFKNIVNITLPNNLADAICISSFQYFISTAQLTFVL